MKPRTRNIIITLLLVAVVVTFHIVRRNATMRGIDSIVLYGDKTEGGSLTLLKPYDVDSIILDAYPYLLKTDIKDINRKGIKKMLEKHPYILSADVDISTGGKLQVEIQQRLPVVRMFYQDNEFYISRQGTVMPLSAKYFCHILVGNSQCEEPQLKHPSTLNLADTSIHNQPVSPLKIWKLASFLHDNPQYGEIFDQVYVGEKGDLYLQPKLGQITIIVGDNTMLEEKFENLWAFFNQGISMVGWDTYTTINLKYKDQVVCTRKKQQ